MSVSKAFVARLANLAVFDEDGDRVGRVRDVVVQTRAEHAPRVSGFVVELPGFKGHSFAPIRMLRSIGAGQLIIEGRIDGRPFEQKGGELRVLADLLDRTVTLVDDGSPGTLEDVAIERDDAGDWHLRQLFVRLPRVGASLFGKGPSRYVTWDEIDFEDEDDDDRGPASAFITATSELKPSDLAAELLGLPEDRMLDIVSEMPDDRLADALEEMHEDDQVRIIVHLHEEHAADILDHMQPDDAADLVARLDAETSEALLARMEPNEADDVRMLLTYAPDTAGGLMTTDPIICSADTTVAEALVRIRQKEISTALATTVFVTVSPYEPPTGRYLGVVHFQRLLRYPPHEQLSTILDTETEAVHWTTSDAEVARVLASYDLVALPVVDSEHRLVGVITIDDVLDHLLPEDWRTRDVDGGVVPTRAASRRQRLTQSEVTTPQRTRRRGRG
ncbi:magnesium transporter MgtE N-terminal domain-containing protein [Pseudoclavibacter endophyticus]|uniref:Magnesium transporter n=1 Tax=Pseudoclavibacter endophyticus TaxID=1778590 RepID=A0A6H9WKU3_9MICO|nr:CBS domain-containing protein [Pseudoclavibacter endophyticus]KAB1649773.1 magnesium transporter [Pseudoclavibacter endophyticus]